MNLRLLLLPFSWLFSLIARVRNIAYDQNWIKHTRFELPVILVGNLSVGGTGKTPHVGYIISLFYKNYRVATLSRGYGRKSTGFVVAGKGTNASLIGDEPMLYFSKYDNITVSVCEDRVEGVSRLLKLNPAPQVVVMDDGFQHRSIDPGLKILLTSWNHLYCDDFVLPAGNLREPASGYKRADIIIVTKCPLNLSAAQKSDVKARLKPTASQQLFFSSISYESLRPAFPDTNAIADLNHAKNVVLVTGIADPAPMLTYFNSLDISPEIVAFPDHHQFTEKDAHAIRKKFDSFADPKAIIVTTEKDLQRLKNPEMVSLLSDLPLFYLPITITLDHQKEFINILETYVAKSKRNS